MQPQEARQGMQVVFGRPNGEKTVGKIIKCNPTKAKVQTLEDRGQGRGSEPGSLWTVPYSMMEPDTTTEQTFQQVQQIQRIVHQEHAQLVVQQIKRIVQDTPNPLEVLRQLKNLLKYDRIWLNFP